MLTRKFACRLVVVASLLACGAMAGGSASAAQFMLRRWPARLAVPPLQLTDVAGRAWDLHSLRGKPVLLNFWATWCEPCAEELPALAELAGRAQGELVVLGVDYKEAPDAVQRFAAAHGVAYPVLLDRSGENFKKWTSGVMPTTILIDRNGKPRWRVIGALDPADPGFRRALDSVLAVQATKPEH